MPCISSSAPTVEVNSCILKGKYSLICMYILKIESIKQIKLIFWKSWGRSPAPLVGAIGWVLVLFVGAQLFVGALLFMGAFAGAHLWALLCSWGARSQVLFSLAVQLINSYVVAAALVVMDGGGALLQISCLAGE